VKTPEAPLKAPDKKQAPYGSWASPITAGLVASGGVRLGQVAWSGDDLYWLEGRPDEGGRSVVVRRSANGDVADVIPEGFNARTMVHEYGGGSYWVSGPTVFFTNFEDQRLYRVDPGEAPRAITPEPLVPRGDRYADGVVTPDGTWVICVRERHVMGREAVNEIVALPTDGSALPRVLVGGLAFFAFPRLSPDGRRLAWTSWGHPRMPWDGTELWVAEVADGAQLRGRRLVAGGPEESIFQPSFSPSGRLHFVSDRSGWWNLYVDRDGTVEPIAPVDAELGVPQWVFGLSTYAFVPFVPAGPDGTIVCLLGGSGGTRLSRVTPEGGYEDLGLPYRSFSPASLVSSGSRLAFIGASPVQAAAVVVFDTETRTQEVVRRSLSEEVDPAFVSVAEPIEFPSTLDGEPVTAHALFYKPTNPGFSAPEGERPPLVVFSHGGPTSATTSALSLEIQFWTSRGFGVVDVNYGGSTGYGRQYRERLKGRWGILDVDDCMAAARFLVDRGDADAARLAIRGGSAGGYTTLCALTFQDLFAAGASYYGVADAEALAKDTHKFESRYLDSLIGEYPKEAALYRERSPIHYTDRLSCPMLILQGLEDKVVPPSQAEAMVEALRAKGLPFAYLAYEGEQHGFRKAENIRRSLEAELYFYAKVFGFQPADDIEPVAIENL
jgi:dipeptidyl aminopeptidase/acylaminoacyl peptidase